MSGQLGLYGRALTSLRRHVALVICSRSDLRPLLYRSSGCIVREVPDVLTVVAYAIDVGKQTKVEPCDVQILMQNIRNTRTPSENEMYASIACDNNEKKKADRNRARPKKKNGANMRVENAV